MTARPTRMPSSAATCGAGRDRRFDARHVSRQQHEALAAEGHGQVDAQQRDVGALRAGVGHVDDARRRERLDDAQGQGAVRRDVHRQPDGREDVLVHVRDDALLDERAVAAPGARLAPTPRPPPRRRRSRRGTCPSRSSARAAAGRRPPSAWRPAPRSRSQSRRLRSSPMEFSFATIVVLSWRRFHDLRGRPTSRARERVMKPPVVTLRSRWRRRPPARCP